MFWLDVPKMAVPLGTVFGVQLAERLKFPVPLMFQVASCAAAGNDVATAAQNVAVRFGHPRRRIIGPLLVVSVNGQSVLPYRLIVPLMVSTHY
jgi:hypothetical protein